MERCDLVKKVLKIITIVLLLFVSISAFGGFLSFLHSKGDIEKVPSIFGLKPLTILSNSMHPAFNAGDIVLINVNREPSVHDIITYKHPDGMLITHRIIEKEKRGGKIFFKTKGDNNNVADDIAVPRSSVVGVEQFVIPKAGYVARFVSGPLGFFLLIVMPLLLVVIYEIFKWMGLVGNEKERLEG
jgi:signal peptidase